jgi:hypothetical protein
MRERNPRHIALGILGMLGVLLYVLSCRPAWSPDSSKVLFPYCNPETKKQGVALYDRNTGTVRSIFSRQLGGDRCSEGIPSSAWSNDGSRAVVFWGEKREKKRKNRTTGKMETVETKLAHVDVLPMGGVGKKLHVKLRDFERSDNDAVFPLAEAGGKIYLTGIGESKVLQLDLKSGKKKVRNLEDDRAHLFYSHDGHITYIREGAENSDDLEFGELDPKDLSLHSRFLLKNESLEAQGVSEIKGFLAFEPDGNRLAMPAQSADKKGLILLCNDRGVEQVFKPELPAPGSRLGNLEWSRDDKTIYATVVTPTEKQGIVQYSLSEIPLAGGPVRLTPVVRAAVSSDDAWMDFQISISPDGSTIAASTAHFDKGHIDPANRGLFLVDVRDPERKVTRIQYPPVTGEKDTARE